MHLSGLYYELFFNVMPVRIPLTLFSIVAQVLWNLLFYLSIKLKLRCNFRSRKSCRWFCERDKTFAIIKRFRIWHLLKLKNLNWVFDRSFSNKIFIGLINVLNQFTWQKNLKLIKIFNSTNPKILKTNFI